MYNQHNHHDYIFKISNIYKSLPTCCTSFILRVKEVLINLSMWWPDLIVMKIESKARRRSPDLFDSAYWCLAGRLTYHGTVAQLS